MPANAAVPAVVPPDAKTERLLAARERSRTFLSSTVSSKYNRLVMPRKFDSDGARVSSPARIAGRVSR